MRVKTEEFQHSFFNILFDTAALVIPSFRMIVGLEVVSRYSNLIYFTGFICTTIICICQIKCNTVILLFRSFF